MTKSPSGLRQSEASLAKNLFGATPAEAVRLNSSRICCRIVRATRVAVAKPVLFSVTSRYASSRDSGSIGQEVWREGIYEQIREMMPLQGGLSVERMCELAPVSRASFYRWLEMPASVEEEMEVRSLIQQIAIEHRRR